MRPLWFDPVEVLVRYWRPRRIVLAVARRSMALTGLLLVGCATVVIAPPQPERPLERVESAHGYRFANLPPGPDNTDGLFMVLAFSGGGTRSAALAYGVLEQLRDTSVYWEGRQRRLLDEVDVINGVSGGSYAAAYYGLHGDAFFTSFPQRFLQADLQSELLDHYVSVTGLAQLLDWSRNDRVDHLSWLIDRHVFEGKTFADLLARRQRPLIVLHATDLALGSDFQFTQDQLDPLCIDLSSFPIARAVAASSAVPILFGPVALKNHAGRCGYVAPSWLRQPVPQPVDSGLSLRMQRHASDVRSYLDADKKTGRPWIHLVDGGVSDNLGLRGAIESSMARGGLAPLLRRLRVKEVRKVVFLVVSAEVLPDLKIDRSGDSPGTATMATAVVDAFMNNNSFEIMAWLRSNFSLWQKEARESVAAGDRHDSPYAGLPEFYLIEVNLRDIQDSAERERMMAVPTTLKLDPEQVGSLIQAGRTLLERAPEFRRLVQALRAPHPPEAEEGIRAEAVGSLVPMRVGAQTVGRE